MKLPAMRDPDITFEERCAYLNYLWSVKDPALISTEYPIYVYGFFLAGTDRYTQKTTYRLIRLFSGAPFGPVRKGMKVGMAW